MSSVLLAIISAFSLVALGDLRSQAWPAIAVLLVWGVAVVALPRPRWGLTALLLVAVLLRTIVLASPPTLSDDLFRYLWEGQVVWGGGNPFLHAPADPVWASRAGDPILAAVNHPEVSTIYPPLALQLFAVLSQIAYDPLSIKVFMGLCDVGIVWVLADVLVGRGRGLDAAWLYALHPLGTVEAAGSGHLESLAILLVLLAVRGWDRGGSGLSWAALGALVKLLPAVLVGVLWRRRPWLLLPAAAVALLSASPFLDAGALLFRGLDTYAEHWSFNAGLFQFFEAMLGTYARPVAMAVGAAVTLGALVRYRDPARVMLWVGGAFVLLSPTVHPWYIAWVWVPALVCGVRGWTVLATLVPVSYAALASYDPASSSWEEPSWPIWVQYLPLLLVLLWEWSRQLTRPGPWDGGRPKRLSPSPSPT